MNELERWEPDRGDVDMPSPEWRRYRSELHWPTPRRVAARILPPALPGPGIRLTDDAPAPLRRWSGAVIVVFYTLAGLVILAAVGLSAGVVAVIAYRLLTAVIG